MESYLVLFHVVSAGQNGTDLGADEEQIVHLSYAIVDKSQNKVSQRSNRSRSYGGFTNRNSIHLFLNEPI